MDVLENSGSDSARVQAASVLLDRAYGRVAQAAEPVTPKNDLAQAIAEINSSKSAAPIRTMGN
jgi:hypothetical protein